MTSQPSFIQSRALNLAFFTGAAFSSPASGLEGAAARRTGPEPWVGNGVLLGLELAGDGEG
jgi:hypothetical protein